VERGAHLGVEVLLKAAHDLRDEVERRGLDRAQALHDALPQVRAQEANTSEALALSRYESTKEMVCGCSALIRL
jgi:hypothetical protein